MSPNDLGKKFIVEECQKIKLPDFLRRYRRTLKELMIGSELEAMGARYEMVTSKNTAMAAPATGSNAPSVALESGYCSNIPLLRSSGLRECLNLSYKKQQYKGMLESLI